MHQRNRAVHEFVIIRFVSISVVTNAEKDLVIVLGKTHDTLILAELIPTKRLYRLQAEDYWEGSFNQRSISCFDTPFSS